MTVPKKTAAKKATAPKAKKAAKSAVSKPKTAKAKPVRKKTALALPVNNDVALEQEADEMGAKAVAATAPSAFDAEEDDREEFEDLLNTDGDEMDAADEFEDELEGEAESELEGELEDSPADPYRNDELEDELEGEFIAKPRPPAKLERLQKILAQAGVASRRKAEEMIEQGRVQVNGKTVTTLGTKADSGRDHIRVDGKLLHGNERIRYYMLNKPKGFVTTVKDPEGRPTVMQFFEKMKERLYPVGRLDYMSEGLLLVTNDGPLANRLTRASSGVEKTYLVKVAGQPSEDQLDLLRGGISIERGKPGTPRVRTSPARIRQVRQGDNPWFEVVLIEGRNRELRKMFEEIGHFVEKIRRIGYGPLVLDQEPGSLRELEEQEVEQLRKAADGKLRTPKAKELRRRNLLDAQLPTIAPKPSARPRAAQPDTRTSGTGAPKIESSAPAEFRPKRAFGQDARSAFPPKSNRPAKAAFSPAARGAARPDARPEARESARFSAKPAGNRPFAAKPFADRASAGSPARPFAPKTFESRPAARPAQGSSLEGRPAKPFAARPARGFTDRPKPFDRRPAGETESQPRSFGDKPAAARPFEGKPARPFGKKFGPESNFGKKNFADRPAKPERESRGRDNYKRPPLQTRADDDYSDLEPRKPVKVFIEPVQDFDRPARSNDRGSRPNRPAAPRSQAARPYSRPEGRTEGRPERAQERRYTTSSGQPRPGGARPSSKPGRSGSGTGPSSGPGGPSRSGSGYRPKPDSRGSGFGATGGGRPAGEGRPKSAGFSRPKPGGFSKSGPKSGFKPGFKSTSRPAFKSGSKPGGFKSKPGGGFGGKKRG